MSNLRSFMSKSLTQNIGHSQNGRFELAQTQSCTKKEPLDKALNLNGGTDEARTRDLLRDRQAL